MSPVGQGFFVTGDVASLIRVECECCGCAFGQRGAAPVKVGGFFIDFIFFFFFSLFFLLVNPKHKADESKRWLEQTRMDVNE